MKCVICKGGNIEPREMEEEIRRGMDVVFVPLKVLVCKQCGERYYDRVTMQRLEDIERKIDNNEFPLHNVGQVLMPS